MLTEDLDAPPIAAFLFFVIVGVILSLERFESLDSSKEEKKEIL